MRLMPFVLYIAGDGFPEDVISAEIPIGANVFTAGINASGDGTLYAEADPEAETETRYFRCVAPHHDVAGARIGNTVIFDANSQLVCVYEVVAPA